MKDGDHYNAIPIKNFEEIKSDLYALYISITYKSERLSNIKRIKEQREIEIKKRREYEKADSLSKVL